jgi:predicted HAD superfamily Cof-like phosphohydrolase
MATDFEDVVEFHKAFGAPAPDGYATFDEELFPPDRVHLRMSLVAEEFIELVEAVYGKAAGAILAEAWLAARAADDGTRDIVETADALADIKYVVNGFAAEGRIPFDAVYKNVHASNMSKLGADGKPVVSDGTDGFPLGKILKGPDFFRPDIAGILAEVPAQH